MQIPNAKSNRKLHYCPTICGFEIEAIKVEGSGSQHELNSIARISKTKPQIEKQKRNKSHTFDMKNLYISILHIFRIAAFQLIICPFSSKYCARFQEIRMNRTIINTLIHQCHEMIPQINREDDYKLHSSLSLFKETHIFCGIPANVLFQGKQWSRINIVRGHCCFPAEINSIHPTTRGEYSSDDLCPQRPPGNFDAR